MGRRQFSIRLVALFLARLVSLCHSLGAQEQAPQRSASQSPSTPPTSCHANTSDDPLAVRIRKLEAINQSIIDRLDQSEARTAPVRGALPVPGRKVRESQETAGANP